MDGLITTIIDTVVKRGADFVATLGWLLYLLERYYVYPRREQEFKKELGQAISDYKALAERTIHTLSSFSTILEVLKDRIGRAK